MWSRKKLVWNDLAYQALLFDLMVKFLQQLAGTTGWERNLEFKIWRIFCSSFIIVSLNLQRQKPICILMSFLFAPFSFYLLMAEWEYITIAKAMLWRYWSITMQRYSVPIGIRYKSKDSHSRHFCIRFSNLSYWVLKKRSVVSGYIAYYIWLRCLIRAASSFWGPDYLQFSFLLFFFLAV